MAREAIVHAGKYAFAHRRDKKNDFRKIWTVRIGAGLTATSLSYSKFIGNLKKANILINRKMLSELAAGYPSVFEKIVQKAS